jgi:hypothetical protein
MSCIEIVDTGNSLYPVQVTIGEEKLALTYSEVIELASSLVLFSERLQTRLAKQYCSRCGQYHGELKEKGE